MSLSIKRA